MKGIAGFYYVDTAEGLIECKARGRFRKTVGKPIVGDRVTLEIQPEDGTGYLFESYDAGAMLDVIGQATGLYRGDRKGFDTVRRRGMTADFSWARSAGEYRRIYGNLLG